ncbi:MAG: type II secretion system F family protein [Phycisphaerales bacterium JB063]
MSQTTFAYIARSSEGRQVKGTVRARDRREALSRVKRLGHFPVRLDATSGKGATGSGIGKISRDSFRRVRQYDLAVFTRQLASLLKAGMTVTVALNTVRSQSSNPKLANIILDVEETLAREACTLAEALERHPKVFDAVYIGLVSSGEASGNLVEVLSGLAKRLSESAKLKGQVLGAFLYPAFLLVLGVTAVFVLIAFVIPRFNDLFESFGQSLPLPTQVLIALSDFFSQWWPVTLAGVLTAILLGYMAWRKPQFRGGVDRILLRLPVVGPMLIKVEVARVSRTLSTMVSGGVRIVEALNITGRTASNTVIRQSFRAIVKGTSVGEPLAEGFAKAKVYPPMMVNMIRTGEETGELPEMLDELAEIYEDEADRAVKGAVRLLEPLLILAMGAVIAGIVAAVILPIFQVNAMIE